MSRNFIQSTDPTVVSPLRRLRTKRSARRVTMQTALILGCLSIFGLPSAKAEQASSADSFVDSIGINVHWEATSTQYGQNYAVVKQMLIDAGIRHVRCGDISHAQDLVNSGIYSLFMADCPVGYPGTPSTIANILTTIKNNNAYGAIDFVEGPNEPDNFWIDPGPGQYYGKKSYQPAGSSIAYGYSQGLDNGIIPGVTYFMTDLHTALKGDSATAGIPIIGPALGRSYSSTAYPYSNPLKASSLYNVVDYGNGHPYPYSGNPFGDYNAYDTISHYYMYGNHPATNISDDDQSSAGAFDVSQPPYTLYDANNNPTAKRALIPTETGYPTYSSPDYTMGTSVAAQGKYMPRLFAEYFRTNVQTRPGAGMARTYSYEFVDEGSVGGSMGVEGHYGIIYNTLNSATHKLDPKPAYTALKSMINLLKDASWNASTHHWDKTTFTPGNLAVTVTPSPVSGFDRTRYVHHLLLQKSNGDYYLLLWHEISDEDTSVIPFRELQPSAMPTTITLPSGVVAVTQYGLDANGNLTSTAPTINGNGQVALNVPDSMTIVQLRPPSAQVVDPGFELETTNAVNAPWYVTGGWSGVDINIGNAHSGKNEAFIYKSSPDNQWTAFNQDIAVTPGTNYVLSAWIRTSPNQVNGNSAPGWLTAKVKNGGIIKEVNFGNLPGYTLQSFSFNSGTASQITIYAGYWANMVSGASWIQLDDVSLTH